jgi:hypothetical protein
MRVFPRWIEHALDVAVQRPHEADAHHHGRPIEIDDQEQGFDRSLPLLESLLGLRQFHDIVGSVLESNELATVGEGDRVLEGVGPFSHEVTMTG